MRHFKLALMMAIVSFIGFLDATYLTVKHFQGTAPPCSLVVGCEIVTTSQYAAIFHVPVALLGSIYYLTILLLSLAYLDSREEKVILWACGLTGGGFLATIWFSYLQQFVIKAWCIYCIGSAITSTLLFILGMCILRNIKKRRELEIVEIKK